MFDFYFRDEIDAVRAKFEAQKIAFSPLSFHAAKALRDLGILETVSRFRKSGITVKEIANKLSLSAYGVSVLAEMGLGMGILKLKEHSSEKDPAYTLGKIGHFILTDEMTRVNMDFSNDVCYAGASDLQESVRSGKPKGLKHFGDWETVYEGLSKTGEQFKKSWFGFDHFYSDLAFPEALPIVFSRPCRKLFDIGGNTAKWAIACCKHNPNVHVSIIDLPGQTAVARENAKNAGFESRIGTISCNVLDKKTEFPSGADCVWMSQFLDCFSLSQITEISEKIFRSIDANTDVYVLEPIWDRQRFEAAAYSLQATSLYFTCIANGNSKMYRYDELKTAIENGGLELREVHHQLGINCYTLFRFQKR